MHRKKSDLPLFGVGPIYVITCLVLTCLGLYLNYKGSLDSGKIAKFDKIMTYLGIFFIIIGLVIYSYAVFIQKILNKVKENKLLMTGVYALVRNPVYSAFSLVFTGILLLAKNLFLLILPIFFWVFLTLLMKFTEEKWLTEKFGDEYKAYCKTVNRIIPWYRKK